MYTLKPYKEHDMNNSTPFSRLIEANTLVDFYVEIRSGFDINTCVLPTCDIKPVHYNKNTRGKFKKRNKSNK